MKKLIALSTMVMASPAFANQDPFAVPEISALEGTAAVAIVVALVLLVWERRRAA